MFSVHIIICPHSTKRVKSHNIVLHMCAVVEICSVDNNRDIRTILINLDIACGEGVRHNTPREDHIQLHTFKLKSFIANW